MSHVPRGRRFWWISFGNDLSIRLHRNVIRVRTVKDQADSQSELEFLACPALLERRVGYRYPIQAKGLWGGSGSARTMESPGGGTPEGER